jgi:lysophospholipase L1-like esterase
MATRRDASLYVLDFIPNVNATQLTEKTRPFFDILRKANPGTPILFVETVIFPHSFYDKSIYGTITEKNRLLREEYEKIKREGDKNVYYLANDDLIGSDGEATVDGIHFTDLGFLRFADKLHEAIRQINNQ